MSSKPRWMICKVDGCETVVRSAYATLCNTHYFRGRRTGTTADRESRPPQLTNHGYLAKSQKGHPAAAKGGVLYEHRRVFYETYGPGPHACNWCGTQVIWKPRGADKLVVDHLDKVQTNNEPLNLVPSCSHCNGGRGLAVNWIKKHMDDPLVLALLSQAIEDCNIGKGAWDQTDWRPATATA